MTIENLSTLKIHKLSQAQYERESAAGRIDENALYLVPDNEIPSLDNYYTKDEVTNYHKELEAYTDHQVAALVNSAPETLDTIGELAAAFEENQDMIATLNAAIVNKAENNEI